MPNRMIRDSIKLSKSCNRMSDTEFRIWIGLIISADDYGRCMADPNYLKGTAFPLLASIKAETISDALEKLVELGCIYLYEVDDYPYLAFPNWRKYQTVRAIHSKWPGPDEGSITACSPEILAGILPADNPDTDVDNLSADCLQNVPEKRESRSEKRESKDEKRETRSENEPSHFVPPTLEEIADYCLERGNGVDPERFFNFYASKGWKVGRNDMKDWKAAVRGWETSEKTIRQSSNPFLAIAEGLA